MTILFVQDKYSAGAHNLGISLNEECHSIQGNAFTHDVSSITLLDDSNLDEGTLGGKSPKELAKDIAALFSSTDKTKLIDFFLLTNNASVRKAQETTLVQQLAVELQALGFSNVKIHTPALPKGINARGIGLELTTEFHSETEKPGQICVYIYENDFSRKLDEAINHLQSRLSDIETKEPSTPSSYEEEVKRVLERNMARLQEARRSSHYKRTEIFKAPEYHKFLSQPSHTFTASGAEIIFSLEVLFAIEFLTNLAGSITHNMTDTHKMDKQLRYIGNDIVFLEKNPMLGKEEIITKLKGDRNAWELSHSHYFNEVIKPLDTALSAFIEVNNHRLQEIEPSLPDLEPIPPRPQSAVTPAGVGFFAGRVTEKKPEEEQAELEQRAAKRIELINRLTQYINDRESEWQYHYNFLWVVSIIYLVQDFLLGTDYYNSKKGETKLNAAKKLKDALNGEIVQYTNSEADALEDGRLGGIVKQYNLETLLLLTNSTALLNS
ncbi:Uncharacterised protein (plasmid) [Legionella adelaidensis]|uniref:Uncharacterized protein n=1 Tax=Legionella adelaidensis TaxID=45056 RepID=A0A0W0R1M2_9GAMM|nr:hypothetical protein [Legionella adelaidensis]KTC64992.1 hypothetical protein Lade_1672 [Legionella adelaidensis]VEH85328.1 Uncharacterised protein [Legionella adelaidensis]